MSHEFGRPAVTLRLGKLAVGPGPLSAIGARFKANRVLEQRRDPEDYFATLAYRDRALDPGFSGFSRHCLRHLWDGLQEHVQVIGLGDLAGGDESIHLRHGEIHDHHVRGELLCLGHRIAAIRGLSADLPAPDVPPRFCAAVDEPGRRRPRLGFGSPRYMTLPAAVPVVINTVHQNDGHER